jgi:hypothetical protein
MNSKPKKTIDIKWWKKKLPVQQRTKKKKPKKPKRAMQFKKIFLFFFTKIFGGSVCDFDNNETIRCTYEIHRKKNMYF